MERAIKLGGEQCFNPLHQSSIPVGIPLQCHEPCHGEFCTECASADGHFRGDVVICPYCGHSLEVPDEAWEKFVEETLTDPYPHSALLHPEEHANP